MVAVVDSAAKQRADCGVEACGGTAARSCVQTIDVPFLKDTLRYRVLMLQGVPALRVVRLATHLGSTFAGGMRRR